MSQPTDDEPGWLKALYWFGWTALYWFGWTALWLFAAVTTLMCLFGCMLYNWEGN